VVFTLFPRLKERRKQLAERCRARAADVRHWPRVMSDPKLLLLDEPSAGLAAVVVQQRFELVKRIRAAG